MHFCFYCEIAASMPPPLFDWLRHRTPMLCIVCFSPSIFRAFFDHSPSIAAREARGNAPGMLESVDPRALQLW